MSPEEIAESTQMRRRVRELEAEVSDLQKVFDGAKTYHNAVALQSRQSERRVLVAALRSRIGLAA